METEKIRVAAVSYLNTKPLLYGFRDHPLRDFLEIREDSPSAIARQLIGGQVDLGLIPVAVLPEMPQYHIVTDYCIGSQGPVGSVCVFSEVPLEKVRTCILDNQSRSSVVLLKLLLQEYWHLEPQFRAGYPGYESDIRGTTAGLVIGDRALRLRKEFPFLYDLGAEWARYSGLPFVFAAWVSRRPLPIAFLQAFNEATSLGLHAANLKQVIAENPCDFFDLHQYYTHYISYSLTDQKKMGMNRFLDWLRLQKIQVSSPVQ